MDSVAVQASVPTFERSHRAFHRERTVTSTPCAGSFLPELPAMLLSGFFPQIVYTPLPELTNFTVEPSHGSWHCGSTRNFDESDAKIRLFTGRKFYLTVHFFLTWRRHSPPLFET